MVTEKVIVVKPKQNISIGFRPQTISVISNPNINNTETTGNIHQNEVAEISPSISPTLTPGIAISLQAPTKTIRTNSDSHDDPNVFELFASKYIHFDASNHQFQFENTETLPVLQSIRIQE